MNNLLSSAHLFGVDNAMHEPFLISALEQAKLGYGQCAPNPCVGAVAVQNNSIIAQSYHHRAGQAHAEDLLLKQFPANTPGVTLYVTLEPCNHWGNTPPCTEAIIQHGIDKVVFAFKDPNPIVSQNNTPEILKKSGIQCEHHPLEAINAFYKTYHYWMAHKKPWVTAKLAHSLDGKIAGPQGKRIKISNDLCDAYTHSLRESVDVILTSAKTILNDNPQMTVRKNGQIRSRTLAVIDRLLRCDLTQPVFQNAAHVHVFHRKDKNTPVKHQRVTYHPVEQTPQGLCLKSVMSQLGQLGFHHVLLEAGGTLFSSLHEQALVQETIHYIAPNVLGESALQGFPGRQPFGKATKTTWHPMGEQMMLQLEWGGM